MRLTVKVNDVVPASPSAILTSPMLSVNTGGPPQGANVVAVLRGFGAPAAKSVAF